MPRNYRHIKPYENERIEMKRQGLTNRQIAERLEGRIMNKFEAFSKGRTKKIE